MKRYRKDLRITRRNSADDVSGPDPRIGQYHARIYPQKIAAWRRKLLPWEKGNADRITSTDIRALQHLLKDPRMEAEERREQLLLDEQEDFYTKIMLVNFDHRQIILLINRRRNRCYIVDFEFDINFARMSEDFPTPMRAKTAWLTGAIQWTSSCTLPNDDTS